MVAARNPNKHYYGGTPYDKYNEFTGEGPGQRDGPSDPRVPDARVVPGVSPAPLVNPYVSTGGGQVTNVSGQIAGLPGFGKTYSIDAERAGVDTRGVSDDELSRHQLDIMLDPKSALMRRAAATGYATAGSRGLMNSSLAAGAAQGAMIDRAQPFALSDADAYRRTASENMAAKNTARLTNAQLGTQANISAANLTGAMDQAGLAAQANALMQQGQQKWATGERIDTQGWQSGEKAMDRQFTAGENALQREFLTGERIGGQDFTAGENIKNREWTSAENMRSNSLQWAVAQLQTYASIGMSREQARSQILADIYGNPNLKAAEQNAAAANAMRVLDGMAYQPYGPPAGLPRYDPATGVTTFPDASAPPPTAQQAIMQPPQDYTQPNITVGQDWSSFVWPGVGTTMNNLPPV